MIVHLSRLSTHLCSWMSSSDKETLLESRTDAAYNDAMASHAANRGFVRPYIRLLKANLGYRLLYSSYAVSIFGDWLSYVGVLTLVTSLAENKGTAISIYLVLRRFPPLLLVPVTGYLADTFDRRLIMIIADLARVVIISVLFILAWIRSASLLWLIFVVVFLHFAFAALFDPARAALVPQLVDDTALLTANVLDGSTRYALLFVGSSVSGVITSFFGILVDFALDAVTFILSAYFIYRLWKEVKLEGDRGYVALVDHPEFDHSDESAPSASSGSESVGVSASSGSESRSAEEEQDEDWEQSAIESDDSFDVDAGVFNSVAVITPSGTKSVSGPLPIIDGSSRSSYGDEELAAMEAKRLEGDGRVISKVIAGFSFWYRNKYVLALTLLKALIALGGGANLLNIYFAMYVYRLPGDKDGSLSTGLMYAFVGIAAVVGPSLFKRYTPPIDISRERAFMVALLLVNIGAYLTAAVPNYFVFILGNLIRVSGGSSIMTMTSAILQTKVPNAVRGRIFAIDLSMFTLSYTTVVVLVGQGLDAGGYSPYTLMLFVGFGYTVVASIFVTYFFFFSHRDDRIS